MEHRKNEMHGVDVYGVDIVFYASLEGWLAAHLHIIPSVVYLFYTVTNEALQLWDITYEALQL